MEAFPANFQWMVWRAFFSKFVLKDMSKQFNFIWKNPSDQLMMLCNEPGTIQQGHHELEDMIEDCDMWAYIICTKGKCINCVTYGFPCSNLAAHGFKNKRLDGLWRANFF